MLEVAACYLDRMPAKEMGYRIYGIKVLANIEAALAENPRANALFYSHSLTI